MESLKRLRILCVSISIGITVITSLLLWIFWGRVLGMGLALGGIGGTLAFWILAVRAEKLASLPPDKVQFWAFQWTFVRLLIYALVLYRAYSLDQESLYGLFAAVAGIFIIRLVMVFVAFTGLDLEKE